MTLNNDQMLSNTQRGDTWFKNPIAIGILLLIILPPIGVVFFMVMGWITLFNRLRSFKPIPINMVTIFFLAITVSSTVSLITIPNLSTLFYIPVPLMLLGYYGIYLRLFVELGDKWDTYFRSYTIAMIVGGLYIFLFSQFLRLTHLKISAPFDYLTGRALLGTPPTPRLYGSTFNPNFASYLLLMVVGFSFAYLMKEIEKRNILKMSLFITLLILNGVAIFDTGSRSAFIAMLVIVELFIIKFNWKLAGLILLVIIIRFHWFLHLIPRNGMIDLSYNGRLIIWKTSLKIFHMHPIFGVSPAGFSVFYQEIVHKYVPHSHDIFIAFLVEYGIVGEIAFLSLAAIIFSLYFKILFKVNRTNLFLSACFVLTLPIIIFTGILDHPLFSPQIAIPTVILIAFFHRFALKTTQGIS
ncbi:O-antigen ligase family protein [Pullulanibacillus sp. KACC 23026]|uniref:O-antigen ligase family protein n=1 Tax=Pullulanibacillus sp. KACC 23026 TaxID=3028315 RepID=UPI0023AFBB15|nr:O-antigen ligase family protein [Pullulanibacillus sp. KACC 23026]WEG11863.1 O-antigen ligase family protein [Pullulanibacillus sp. KACC 23026]